MVLPSAMQLVERIRLSLGTAIQLGLEDGESDPCFTTVFLMTYKKGRCNANCAFCAQARASSSSSDRLSRMSWPDYEMNAFLNAFIRARPFERVCLQALDYPDAVVHAEEIVRAVRKVRREPISVSIHPLTKDEMRRVQRAGATSIGVAFDACTPSLFDSVKGAQRGSSFRWENHLQALRNALEVFGHGNVTTHLMIGLGETETEAADFIFAMLGMGVSVGLFAFTSIRGTDLEQRSPPKLSSYRRVQIVRYLASRGLIERSNVETDSSGELMLKVEQQWLRQVLSSGAAFQTTGCKGCNRPYYNERPTGPMFNFPRSLTEDEIRHAMDESKLVM